MFLHRGVVINSCNPNCGSLLYYNPKFLLLSTLLFRLLNHSLDAPNGLRRDYDTSEGSMRSLESRIQAFHIKYGEGHKTKNLPRLRRYKLDVSFLMVDTYV